MESENRPKTVSEYLLSLPAERRAVVSKLRSLMKRHLPKGYTEQIVWGAIASKPVDDYVEPYRSGRATGARSADGAGARGAKRVKGVVR